MSPSAPLGQLLHSYFLDHLIAVKGLRPGSVRSYRDTIRLLLLFIATDKRCKLTRLRLGDLTIERVLAFLRHLKHDRGNSISTRNQRLAAVRSLFEYIATRSPEMPAVCQQVAAIPAKRVPPPETRFLERDQAQRLLAGLPSRGRLALRDRALVLFLYNTGARVQEAADLRVGHLDLSEHPTVRLHGKGDKWWNALGLTETGFVGLSSNYTKLVRVATTVGRRRPRRGRTPPTRSRCQYRWGEARLQGEWRAPRRIAARARQAVGCRARSAAGRG